ncbi:4313_t:CDS:2 [Ambispora gerdemannii]|uniref:4313_t:CDS:1 n=1 Tax=Ambispora gerdemannii TaxID=144530 RepID=A0A9N8WM95_9GLOM|nr:4313_t:CDS:2 [Ambispora gerdemannii]
MLDTENRYPSDEESSDELDPRPLQSDEFRIIHKKCFHYEKFRTNFAWTTGNLQLDLIIQESQAEANISGDYLEDIPYEQFELVEFHKAGAFSEIYSVIWLERPKWDWNENTQAWSRGGPIKVTLKKLKNSQNLKVENTLIIENQPNYNYYQGRVGVVTIAVPTTITKNIKLKIRRGVYSLMIIYGLNKFLTKTRNTLSLPTK